MRGKGETCEEKGKREEGGRGREGRGGGEGPNTNVTTAAVQSNSKCFLLG